MPLRDGTVACPLRPVPILTYHNIGDAPPGATHRGLYLSLPKFRAHLAALGRHHCAGLSMDEGLPHLRGTSSGRAAIITFDDGYADNVEYALPVLREHGCTATCYLVASQIGGSNVWDWDEVRARKPLMDLSLVRQWLGAGMKVGSHTLTHPRLSGLDRASKRREIVDSKALLEDRLGVPIQHFCFPYGDHDPECLELVREAGYVTAVTTQRGRVRPGQSLYSLPRIGNSGKRSRFVFQARALAWELPGLGRKL